MKFLVLAACVAACNAAAINVGTAGYLGGGGYVTGLGAGIGFRGLATGYAAGPLVGSAPYAAIRYGYSGPLNLNAQLIAHPNGAVVPVDEPAVAIARAGHLISKGAAYAASAPIFNAAPLIASAPTVATAPIAVAAAPIAANVGYAYSGPLNLNTALQHFPNGAVVPIDEPAVASARADHFIAQGAAFAAAAPIAVAAPLIAAAPVADAPFVYSGPLNLNTELTAFPNGAVVPVDEPAVAIARTEHLASRGAALAAATPIIAAAAPALAAAPIVDAPFVYAGPLNLNTELTAFPNGAVVPVDEPAVASARAEHLAAQGAALAAATPIVAAPLIAAAPALTAAPIVDAPFVYAGPLNMNTELSSFPNGAVVPVDEPAVAFARAEHLAAQGAALAPATPIAAAAAPLISAAPALAAALIVDAPFVYAGPLNLNTELTAFPNGAVVPVDEPAVAFARAEHLDALAAATPIAAAPAVAAAPTVTAPFGYSGPLNLNTELFTHPNGAVVPIDEPAVAVARSEHLGAFVI